MATKNMGVTPLTEHMQSGGPTVQGHASGRGHGGGGTLAEEAGIELVRDQWLMVTYDSGAAKARATAIGLPGLSPLHSQQACQMPMLV